MSLYKKNKWDMWNKISFYKIDYETRLEQVHLTKTQQYFPVNMVQLPIKCVLVYE